VSGGTYTADQRLEIRRGDCGAQTVVEFAAPGAVPDFGLCELYGTF
jgi:hypothetical protein